MGLFKAASEALAPIFRPAGTQIEGIEPGSWASPQQPIRPTLQLAVGVRQWNFNPGLNLQFSPRGDVAVKFQQLANVANSFDLCRLMIERRKNKIVNRPWQIRVKPQPGEHEKDRIKREKSTPQIGQISQMLRYPDGVRTFDKWLRMWLEQMYVYDAAAVIPVKNRLGEVVSLRNVSGATITPLVDQYGFIPQPPNPAYQQIILGIPTANLSAPSQTVELTQDELIYSPKNPRVDSRWGFSPVEQIITTLAIAASRQQFFLDFYRSGNVPEGLIPMPESWTPAQIKDFQTWFDSMLAGNLRTRRRLTAIPDTKNGVQWSKEGALTDNTDEYLARVVAYAFGESPQPLVKMVGHQSTAKEGNDQSTEALEDDLKHVEVEMNRIIELVLKAPDVEFSFSEQREVDPLKQAQTDQIYIVTGTYTRNEIREARGDDPRPEPQADMLGVDTPTGFMPLDQYEQQAEQQQQQNQQQQQANEQQANTPKPKVGKRLMVRTAPLTPESRIAHAGMLEMTKGFLANQASRVASVVGLEIGKAQKADKTLTDEERALAIIAGMKVWDYEEYVHAVQPYLEQAAKSGAATGSYQMATQGANLPETLRASTEEAKNYAAGRSAMLAGFERAGRKLVPAERPHWSISVTARQDVLKTIQQALREKWTPSQVEAVIQGSQIFSPDHAEMIADQEIRRAQGHGQYAAWRESRKVAKVAWRVGPGHEVGDVCDAYAAEGNVKVGHEFARGVFAPPDAHPNCECWLEVTEFTPNQEGA